MNIRVSFTKKDEQMIVIIEHLKHSLSQVILVQVGEGGIYIYQGQILGHYHYNGNGNDGFCVRW